MFPLLHPDERARATRLFGDVEALVDFEPALIHADLGPEHLLVHDGRLAGANWDVAADFRRRARFYHRLAPWYEAHYGLFTNEPGTSTAAWPGSGPDSEQADARAAGATR